MSTLLLQLVLLSSTLNLIIVILSVLDFLRKIDRLQLIQNSLAKTMFRLPKFSHVTHLLQSLHWLKIRECIIYKTVSLTNKWIEISRPLYLSSLITLTQPGSTRSSKLVTLQWPSNPSRSKITKRSFHIAAPEIWSNYRQPWEYPLFKTAPLNTYVSLTINFINSSNPSVQCVVSSVVSFLG